jgi:hypothetical protein
MPYVSITGIRLKSIWSAPLFFRHAFFASRQARRAPGNLLIRTRRVDGVLHTLTFWRSREDMLAFMKSGAHREAMKDFHRIGSGGSCGFVADEAPSWEEAVAYWRANYRPY